MKEIAMPGSAYGAYLSHAALVMKYRDFTSTNISSYNVPTNPRDVQTEMLRVTTRSATEEAVTYYLFTAQYPIHSFRWKQQMNSTWRTTYTCLVNLISKHMCNQ